MLLRVLFALFIAAATVYSECDVSHLSDSGKELGLRLCKLEEEMLVVERALQEVLQRVDMTIADSYSGAIDKRKNEFIRFGKRSGVNEKRKNEFIRFGKRKNEFIRFGRSDPSLYDDLSMDKRKNEFIRFGRK